MNFSAPRVEAISSLDSSQEQYAGQPQEDGNNTWLARAYDWCIEKFIDDAEYFCIAAFAAMPVALATGVAFMTGEPFWMLMIPLCGSGCYLTAMQGVTMLRDKITERDERIAEINDSALWRLCERRRELNEALMAENSHLEQDVMHWKVLCLTERGGLGAEDTAAGELSRSENKEASAAVFNFPNGSEP
jgi:hypothetical protein